LRNIVQSQPKSIEQLAQITGMNLARTERFGAAFMKILQSL
jgi:hypothetical protein